MASINNWLRFSLSSNQDHPQNSVSDLSFHSDHISAAQISSHEYFDLSPNSTIPSIFEAFNTNSPSQDWNMKDESINLLSCNTNQNEETPKLENFLEVRGNSFTDHNINGKSSNMGLSMIKNWRRSHETPPVTAAGAQTLSLSMSTDSQSADNDTQLQQPVDSQNSRGGATRKSVETFGQRTSIYRGVTRHRWTGRYEAHLWDNSCRREGQTRKGRQVYLGGYDKEEKAARSYDLAALKYWGTTTTTNFPISNYERELEEMPHMTRQEYVASLRRKSSGFSRGASIYRGVTRHHQHGRWQARIGRVAGNKDLYLGTFSTQEEAAEAYDVAAIKFRGLNAVTNFEINRYDVRSIMESRNLPISKRHKEAEAEAAVQMHGGDLMNTTYQVQPYQSQRLWCKQEQDSELLQASMHIGSDLQVYEENAAGCDGNGFGYMNLYGNLMPNTHASSTFTMCSSAGAIPCGKPIVISTVPSYCSVHFQKAEKHMLRALKKSGLYIASTTELAPKLHLIV